MFLLFSNFVVLLITLDVFRRLRLRYLAGTAALALIALYLTSRVNGMVSWIFNFPLTQPEGWTKTSTWISHWLLQTIWVPVQSLGVEPLGQPIAGTQPTLMPDAVWIVGVALLGAALVFSFIRTSRKQIFLLLVSFLLIAFVVMSFNGRLDRDLFKLSGRYVLPVFSFVIGYSIFLSRSPFQLMEIKPLRNFTIAALSAIHALSLHAIIETNVDGQSFSIEPIWVGADGWWWVGLPLGPNFIIIFGSFGFTWFLMKAWSIIGAYGVDDLIIRKENSK
jgi:hypothetical protein